MTGLDPATLEALRRVTVGDALGEVPLPVQLLVAALLVGTGVWTAVRPAPLRAVAFVACTLMWARANQALEGPILLTLTPDHGLVVGDLLPVALLGLVLHRTARRRAGRRPGGGPQPDGGEGDAVRGVPAQRRPGVGPGVGPVTPGRRRV